MKTIEQLQNDYFTELRTLAIQNPVPLPDNPSCLFDLACIGVVGASEKLCAGGDLRGALLAHYVFENFQLKQENNALHEAMVAMRRAVDSVRVKYP